MMPYNCHSKQLFQLNVKPIPQQSDRKKGKINIIEASSGINGAIKVTL